MSWFLMKKQDFPEKITKCTNAQCGHKRSQHWWPKPSHAWTRVLLALPLVPIFKGCWHTEKATHHSPLLLLFKPTSLSGTAKETEDKRRACACAQQAQAAKDKVRLCPIQPKLHCHQDLPVPGGQPTWEQPSVTGFLESLTEGPWGPKNGDCHLIMASILADGDVLCIGNHVLPHWIQVGGTVWRMGRMKNQDVVLFVCLFAYL